MNGIAIRLIQSEPHHQSRPRSLFLLILIRLSAKRCVSTQVAFIQSGILWLRRAGHGNIVTMALREIYKEPFLVP